MYDSSIKDVKSPEEKTRLTIWQQRRARADSDYSEENKRMDERETLYKGKRKIKPLVKGDHQKDGTLNETPHVNNLVFENVESMVSTSIPTPKVTAKRKKDEKLAAVIEHWLRNELDRLSDLQGDYSAGYREAGEANNGYQQWEHDLVR